MSVNPLDTPQARRHAEQCRKLTNKLATFLDQTDVAPEYLLEHDDRPVLQVVPTRDESGRVRMTIDQLAALLDMPRDELLDPDSELVFETREA